MSETTIGACPDCGIGEYYEHDGWRFCNDCGFVARLSTWNHLSSLAAEVARLRALLARGAELMPLEQLSQWEGVRAELEATDE